MTVPKLKTFAEKEADRALKARLATLPKDVQDAVRAMEPDARQAYLDSLDRVDDLEAKGETWTPDPATWGLTKSGKPKAKPGRKPAQAPGARTKEKPEPFVREMDLDAIIGDFDPDAPLVFGVIPGEDGEPPAGAPAAPRMTEQERDEQERAEQQAILEAALRQRGIATDNIMAGPFAAVRLVPQGDPEVLETYSVERVPCQLRLVDTGKAYLMQLRYPPAETWEPVGGAQYDPAGCAATLARMQVRPTDSDAFGRALGALAKPHPAVAAKFDNRPRDAHELAPKTEADRRQHVADIRERMIEQRRANALHRQPSDAREERTWLTGML